MLISDDAKHKQTPPRLRSALLCLLDGPVFYVRLLEAEQKV